MANFGNAGVNVCRNPGMNNWDLAVGKRVPIWKEGRYIQFRTELFNAFNHTQFSGLDTGTQFQPPRRECRATRPSDASPGAGRG